MRSSLFALVIALFLAGCAGPRYQTIYRYDAPTDPNARACLQSCEPKLASCQSNCQQRYQSCSKEIEPLVETGHSEALKRYQNELDRYRLELHHHQLQWAMGWGHPHSFGYQHGLFYSPWPEPFYAAPNPPRKPSREEAFNRIRKERCDADCGCQPIYDACFLGCGGKKIPEVQCIANCPKSK